MRRTYVLWTSAVALGALRGVCGCSTTLTGQTTADGGVQDAADESSPSSPDGSTLSNLDGAARDASGSETSTPGLAPEGGQAGCVQSAQIHGDLQPVWSLALGTGSLGGIAVASNGLVVGGSTAGSLRVGSSVIAAPGDGGGGASPFVLKVDASGNLLWHRTFSGWGNIDALGVDGSGNIYITGNIAGFIDVAGQNPPNLDLGNGVLQGSLFLAKLDPNGATLWSKAFQPFDSAGSVYVSPVSLAVDPAGNTAVMSAGAQPQAFGEPVVDAGTDTGFIAAFDAAGTVRYSKVFDGLCLGACAQFDSAGNLFVGGSFGASLDLGATLPSPTPAAAISAYAMTGFVAKLGLDGQVQWRLANGTYSATSAVTSNGTGTFIGGTFSGKNGITTPTLARGPNDIFLSQLDESGAPVFETTVPAVGASVDALAADPTGGVVAFGRMQQPIDFGGGVLTGPPGYWLAKLDSTGAHAFSARFATDPYTGLSGSSNGESVAVDGTGNVFVAGGFYGPAIDLGSGSLPGAASTFDTTVFLAKYAQAAGPATRPRAACPLELDGGPPDAGRLIAPLIPGSAVDVELGPAKAYWATVNEVMSAPLTGGDPSMLAFVQKNVVGLAIDSQSLYWANTGGPYRDGTIVSTPLSGGATVTLAGSQDSPRAITVDDVGVYWTAGGSVTDDGGTSPGSVLSAPFDGGAPTVLASGLRTPGPIAARNGIVLYAVAGGISGSQIAVVPRTGGASTVLATSDRAVVSVALDDTTAYWADGNTSGVDSTQDDGRIRSVTLVGDAGAVLASSVKGPMKLILLGSSLYWSTMGSWGNGGPAGTAGVWTLPAGGGTPTALLGNLMGVYTFAIDSSYVAWTDSLDADTGLSALFVTAR